MSEAGAAPDPGGLASDRFTALRRCIACDTATFAATTGAERRYSPDAAELDRDFADLLSAAGDRRARVPPRPAHPIPPDGEGWHGASGAPLHAGRRRGSRRYRPSSRRPNPGRDGRRRHAWCCKAFIAHGRHLSTLPPTWHRSWATRFRSMRTSRPPENRGFAAHYDVHDVFVLQVAGHKRWHDSRASGAEPAARPTVATASAPRWRRAPPSKH